MSHIFITSSLGTKVCSFNVPFSRGDIVKVKNDGACLAYRNIKSLFDVNDPNVINPSDYPTSELKKGINQWKIVDFGANYCWELCILLKNRLGKYAVMVWTERNQSIELLRKINKEEDDIFLSSKY